MRYFILLALIVLLSNINTTLGQGTKSYQTFTSNNLSEPYIQTMGLPYSNFPDYTSCRELRNCATMTYYKLTLSRGSSDPSFCYGRDSINSCWLDDACFDYGDCCVNYIDMCKRPSVTNIIPRYLTTNSALTSTITIIGSEFGSASDTKKPFDISMNNRFYYRRKMVTDSSWHSYTDWYSAEIVTYAPAEDPNICGADIKVEIVNEYGISSRILNSFAYFSYRPPTIIAMSTNTGSTAGGNLITLEGTSFGPSTSIGDTRVTIAGVPGYIERKNHDYIVFQTPTGSGANLPVVVSYCGQTSAPYLFRYAAPLISSITPGANIITGQTITINGDNFGATATAVSVKIGDNVCTNPVLAIAHKRITCRVPIGCCSQQAVTVTIGGQSSNTVYTNYARPSITAISPNTSPTLGNTLLTITGTSFGTTTMGNIPLSVAIGASLCDSASTACPVSEWTDTRIVLRSPLGEGTAVPVYVYVGDQYSTDARTINYIAPVITSITPTTANTDGTTTITVTGTNFGLTGRVTVNGRTCTSPTRSGHIRVVCTAPVGAGQNVPVVLTVGGQNSNTYTGFSYKRPAITSVNGDGSSVIVRSDTAGGIVLTLVGENFSAEPTVKIGTYECYFSQRSHTRIICTTSEGEGSNLQIVVNAAGQTSVENFRLSYNPPIVTSFSPLTALTSGGTALTLSGANFGTTGSVTVGSLTCPTFSHSHTEVVCNIPAGMGTDLSVAINVKGQSDSGDPTLFSYSPPAILAFSPLSGSTAGGYFLTITGTSFGTSGGVWLRPPSCVVDTAASCADDKLICNSSALPSGSSWTHGQIVCPVPASYGSGLALRILRGDSQATVSTDTFSYNSPTITAIQPSSGATNGGTAVTLTGTNFGGGSVATVTLGGAPCTVTSRSHTSIVFTVPQGYGVSQEVVVTVGALTSNSALFSYDDPVIVSIAPTGLPTVGGQPLTITGTSFAGVTSALQVTVGDIACPVTAATHTSIVCTLPPGGGSRLARVSVISTSTQISNQVLYRFAIPVISTLQLGASTTPLFNTAGGETITINGSNFGVDLPVVQIAGRKCTNVVLVGTGHNRITCTTPAVNGVNQNVLVTVNGVSGNKAIYNTAAPVITSVTNVGGQAARATSGGTILTIAGSNFGTLATVLIDGQNCPVIEATRSHTQLQCTLPSGAGSNLSFYVSVLSQNSNVIPFSYADPSIDSFTPQNSPTVGGSILTITGSNFGPPGGSAVVGTRTCITVSGGWSHTQILCAVPAGMGTDLRVGLFRGGNTIYNTNTDRFSYSPPVITTIAPSAPTSGGTSVTITGENLGILSPVENSVTLTLPDTAVVPTTIVYHTHKQIVITSPPGYGTNLLVTVSVGGQTTSATGFNYQKPALQTSTPTSGSTAGGTLVTVTGVSFGVTKGSVLFELSGGTATITGTDIVSWTHTKVVFASPPGYGRNVRIILRTGDGQLTTETTFLFHYNNPSVQQLTLAGATSGIAVPTGPLLEGDRMLTLTGDSFSTTGSVTMSTSLGVLTCDHTAPGGSWSHKQIVCRIPEGRGTSIPVVVTTSTGSSNQMLISYADPVVLSISPEGGPTSGLTELGDPYLITITGTSFAETTAPFSATATVASQDCVVVSQTHKSIVCALPPGSGSADVQVMVGTRKSNIESYDYAAPFITSFTPLNAPTAGNVEITITGDNFGTNLANVVVVIGGQDCPLTVNPTHTTLICMLPPGEGIQKDVIVAVGSQIVSAPTQFNYDGPKVLSMLIAGSSTLTSPTMGGAVLTIDGESFGSMSVVQVLVGVATCELTYQSQERITCSVPAGMGVNLGIFMKIGSQEADYDGKTYSLSYEAPTVTSVTPRTGPTGSATLVTITGASFGIVDAANTVSFGGVTCDPVAASWSHTRIVCSMPLGLGQNLPLTVSVKGQTFSGNDNADLQFSYAGPTITSIIPTNMPTSGTTDASTILTIYGTNFGPSIPAIATPITIATTLTTIAPVTCTPRADGWTDTRIYCDLSPGYGRFTATLNVDHGSGNVLSTTSGTYRYGTPVVSAKSTSVSPTAGGSTLTITGSNFGQGPISAVQVTVAEIACPVTSVTDTAIECTIPAFFGLARAVAVTIHGETVTTPANFVISYGTPTITAIREITNACTVDGDALIECPVTVAEPYTTIIVEGTNLFDNNNGARTTINIGSAVCLDVAVVTPHTQLSCNLPLRQSGYDLPVKVTILTETNSALLSNSFPGISYAGPKIGGIVVDGSSPTTIPVTSVNGGTSITISGSDFGVANSVDVYIGDTNNPANLCLHVVVSSPCTNAACTVVCEIPPGVGADLPITLMVETVAGFVQATEPSAQKVTYPAPAFVPNTVRLQPGNAGTTNVIGSLSQGEQVYFDVRNTLTDTSRITIDYTGTDTSVVPEQTFTMRCNDVRAVTTTDPEVFTLSCITNANPGYDGPYSFIVTVAGQAASGTDTYRYPTPPRVTYVYSSSCVQSGDKATECPTDGASFVITGTDFNVQNMEVRIGTSICLITATGEGPYVPTDGQVVPSTSASNTRHVFCTLTGGSGKDNPIILVSSSFYAPVRRLVSFREPQLLGVVSTDCTMGTPNGSGYVTDLTNCPREEVTVAPMVADVLTPVAAAASTPAVITLLGKDFGTSGATVYVGDRLITSVVHDSVTPSRKLTFTLNPSFGMRRDVLVIQANGGTAQGVTISFTPCPQGTYESNDSAYCAPCSPGSYNAIAGSYACTPCGPGTYQNTPGAASCKECSIGFANKVSGMTACTACEPGYYADSTALSECIACPAGRYNTLPQQTTCSFCPAGTHVATASAATSCTDCQPGYYSANEGVMTCLICPAGKYSDTHAALGCKSCETGKVQAQQGQTSCSNCGSGYYMDITDQTQCLPCDNGQASSITTPVLGIVAPPASPERVTQCATCPIGSFSVKSNPLDLFAAGPTQCAACPAGKYTSTTGQQGCIDCPQGKFSSSGNQSSCQDCAPGFYGASAAATACTPCASGKYTDTTAAVTCLSCAAGTYTPLPDTNTYCTSCAIGKYQSAAGMSGCINCLPGTYASATGQTFCLACTSGTFTANTAASSCTACAVGRYSVKAAASDIGPTSCSLCEAGTFASTTGQATCASCSTGYYSASTGSSACTACVSGKYNSLIGQSSCADCPAGAFSGAAAVSCISCPSGYFKADTASTCEACPAGTYAATPGAKACTDCPRGQYNDALGQSTCRQCPIGRFTNTLGTTQCTACATGKYQNTAGSTSCSNCAAGRYASATGQTACFDCPKGEFIGNTGAAKCNSCPIGKFGAVTGLSDCTSCAIGRYAPVTKLTECLSCAPGTYQDATGASTCVSCAVGRYQINSGSSACSDCSAGRYASSAGLRECAGCPAGRYQPSTRASVCVLCNAGKYTSDIAQTECADCPTGRYAATAGAMTCLQCALGKYQGSTGKTVCTDCAAGTFRSALGGVECSACAAGSYQSQMGQAACSPCASGKYQSMTQQTSCEDCDTGTFSLQANGVGAVQCTNCPVGKQQPYEGQPSCSPCPAGSYQVPGVGCTLCPKGHYQPNSGATECLACPVGTYAASEGSLGCSSCAVGRYAELTASHECDECPRGTFQDSTGQSQCKTCAPGYFTSTTGQAMCVACAIGTYQLPDIHDSCTECAPGTFQVNTGSTSCQPCSVGRYNAASGQVNCIACAPGTYNDATSKTVCTACPAGTYANEGGLASCKDCTEGTFTADTGSFTCKNCPTGKYQAGTAASACDNCPSGRYQDVMGELECVDCPTGRYATSAGMSSCLLCSTGFFSNTTKATACTECPLGTYQPQMGSSTCAQCIPGKYGDSTAAVDCTACQPGTYNPSSGASACTACAVGKVQTLAMQTQCVDCEAGKYTITTAQTQCIPCSSGTFSAALGATHCSQCEAGKYSELLGNAGPTTCNQCEVGKFQPNTAQERCTECASGRYSNVLAAKSCPTCVPGKYAYFAGSTVCTDCETGRFSDETGAMECSQCPVGTFSNSTGNTRCTSCAVGKFQNNVGASSCTLCPAGTYQNAENQSMCLRCPIGRFSSEMGSTGCQDCPAGHYANQAGLSECLPCSSGYYQASTGQGYCLPCQPGSYTTSTAAVSCDLCPEGTSQPLSGGEGCIPCAMGTYMSEKGQPRCLACQAGKFGVTEGAKECSDCAPGKFQNVQGMTTCDLCDKGTYSTGAAVECSSCDLGTANNIAGNSFCVVCDPLTSMASNDGKECLCGVGYYLPDYTANSPFPAADAYINGTNDFKCVPCPTGADCSQPGNKWSELKTAEGWWRATNETDVFYRCLMPSYCPGGTAAAFEFTDTSGSPCLDNRVGVLCQSCEEGYKTAIGGGCELCPDTASSYLWLIIFLVVIAALLCLSVYLLWRAGDEAIAAVNAPPKQEDDVTVSESDEVDFEDEDEDEDSSTKQTDDNLESESLDDTAEEVVLDNIDPYSPQHINKILPGPPVPAPSFTYKLKIFLSFLQITTNVSNSLEIQWPDTFKSFVLFFDFANIDSLLTSVTSAECYDAVNYYSTYTVTVLLPVLFLAVIFIFWIIPRSMNILCFRHQSVAERIRSKMRTWMLVLYFFFLIYPVVSSTVLNHYVCKSITDSVNNYEFLLVDLRVSCKTDTWWTFAYIGIPLIFVYPVGIPLFFYTILYRNKNKLQEPRIQAQYGFLYAGYHANVWWWEICDSIHKLFMTSLLAFFPIEAQLPVGMCVAVLYLMALLVFAPYIRKEDDVLHIVCQNLIFMLILAGYLFYKNGNVVFTTLEDVGMTIALLFAVVVFLGIFIAVTAQTFKDFFIALYKRLFPKKTKPKDLTALEQEVLAEAAQEEGALGADNEIAMALAAAEIGAAGEISVTESDTESTDLSDSDDGDASSPKFAVAGGMSVGAPSAVAADQSVSESDSEDVPQLSLPTGMQPIVEEEEEEDETEDEDE